MDKPLVLVVDDDPGIRKLVKAYLELNQFTVALASDGDEAIQKVEAGPPALILLDIRMPHLNGIEVVRSLRKWSSIPIIMFSGFATDKEKTYCLDLGADDFISKPFHNSELLARIRAVLRRVSANPGVTSPPVFKSSDLEVSFAQRRVLVQGREVKLTPTEFALLKELVLNADKVLTHDLLLKRVWGPEYGNEHEYLRTFIGHLRKSLGEDPDNPIHLHTITGVGYVYRTE